MILWVVASSLAAYPHYLPYFNEIAGGPDHGIEWLDDSNVDWGQDMILLRDYLARHGVRDARITGMARYPPSLYGIPGQDVPPHIAVRVLSHPDPPPGVYVVSVHLLNRARLGSPPVDPLRDLRPAAVLGHTLWVFDLRRSGRRRSPGESGGGP